MEYLRNKMALETIQHDFQIGNLRLREGKQPVQRSTALRITQLTQAQVLGLLQGCLMSSCIFGDEITRPGFRYQGKLWKLFSVHPPPHSPSNDDIVHKLPPVSILEESSFVCLLLVYLIVIFLRRSDLRRCTRCRPRIKAKTGPVARRIIKQQQPQTSKLNTTTS